MFFLRDVSSKLFLGSLFLKGTWDKSLTQQSSEDKSLKTHLQKKKIQLRKQNLSRLKTKILRRNLRDGIEQFLSREISPEKSLQEALQKQDLDKKTQDKSLEDSRASFAERSSLKDMGHGHFCLEISRRILFFRDFLSKIFLERSFFKDVGISVRRFLARDFLERFLFQDFP